MDRPRSPLSFEAFSASSSRVKVGIIGIRCSSALKESKYWSSKITKNHLKTNACAVQISNLIKRLGSFSLNYLARCWIYGNYWLHIWSLFWNSFQVINLNNASHWFNNPLFILFPMYREEFLVKILLFILNAITMWTWWIIFNFLRYFLQFFLSLFFFFLYSVVE